MKRQTVDANCKAAVVTQEGSKFGLNDVMLPAVDASGTNIERFRSLFEVPSILGQSECLLFHIDTDSTEHHGELRLYREKMDFLNFR